MRPMIDTSWYERIDPPLSNGHKYRVIAAKFWLLDGIEGGGEDPTIVSIGGHCRLIIYHNEIPELWVSSGLTWDGPSGPAIDTPTSIGSSCLHDQGYKALREGILPLEGSSQSWRELRLLFDRAYRKYMLADGMHPLRASWQYWALRLRGGKRAKRKVPS
jgi:hypothetical protein